MLNKMRGFEVVERVKSLNVELPRRATKNSAGYDFIAFEDVEIPSIWKSLLDGIKPTMVKTGIKSYMQDDEMLCLYNRSSNPKKRGLILANSVGIVDADYYNNSGNEGEIMFAFYNIFPWTVSIVAGEAIGQGIFTKFLKSDDVVSDVRVGGYGSTDK